MYVQGEDLPYSAYDRYYIRSDDEDNVMASDQLEQFLRTGAMTIRNGKIRQQNIRWMMLMSSC